ncbi:MAG TPA: sigma-70 family RNA polymerase sigma factor [Thiotrichaceae bacterium]|nr:sigma-70 family RNA polymerase sigma factor [Thiotrichaceae bacterium]
MTSRLSSQEVGASLSSELSDEDLMKLIAEGSQPAFTVLYKRYSPILLRFCSRMLNGDVALGADIVDEAMFEVWGSAGKFAGKSKPSTWIHSIARNKLIDFLRKNSDSKIDKALLKISMDESEPSAEIGLAEEQRGQQIVRHMDKLSDDHREVLLLSYFKELSIKGISTTLNISENTVKTRLFYARQKFKKILSKTGIHREYSNE